LKTLKTLFQKKKKKDLCRHLVIW